MEDFFWIAVLRNIGLVIMAAYITVQLPAFRRALHNFPNRSRDKLFLIFVLGIFSAFGNLIGIPIEGAIANTRIVGPVVGGLLGGPVVGVGVGIIGAIPRYFMGGFTMWPSILSNILAGYISGLVGKRYGIRRINFILAILVAFVCEVILKVLILTMAKPFEAAWTLEKVIAIPTIVANCLASGLFIYIIQDVFKEQEKLQAQSAQYAMRVIRKTSGLLRTGLNKETAQAVAEIIYREIHSAAVAITDAEKVLAFVGKGSDHHAANAPIVTLATKQMMQKGEPVIVNEREGIGCPNFNCPLTAVVEAPLILNGELLGSFKLYKMNNEVISPYEVELICGVADFLSMQLAQFKMDEQQRLLSQAEFAALKAQINPHFLFNSLSTIRILTRTNPETARSLIKDLADFLRKTLRREREMVSLAEEMETVRHYIHLEEARFGDRIQIDEEVEMQCGEACIPVFTIQPLVENALKHGLSLKTDGGKVKIKVCSEQQMLVITVEDNGVGIAADRLANLLDDAVSIESEQGSGIGLRNIRGRLQKIYGNCAGLQIESRENKGTLVRIYLPFGVGACESK
jgi:LytS/YehU family sensor histidine kinase